MDIILNKYSKIIDRDVAAHNGIIHVIDKVLQPVTKSVYEILDEDPSYSIFKQGIDITGLKDTLNVITFDSMFNQFEIHSIDDLVAKYTDDPDNVNDINNGFYRYMEYHCLAGTHYLSDLELGTKVYPVLSYDNYISVTVNDDYKINQDSVTKEYTTFNIDQSNIPGKNGTIHTVNGLLPVIQPKPTTIIWETTDHFDLKQIDEFGKTYARFYDGQNSLNNIKWEGSFLLYYYRDQNTGPFPFRNYDCLFMSGWWWCEVTTPKILKGKYQLFSEFWLNRINLEVYVDGEYSTYIRTYTTDQKIWGEFNWDKTETHTVRIIAKSPGELFWDALIFTPIEDE